MGTYSIISIMKERFREKIIKTKQLIAVLALGASLALSACGEIRTTSTIPLPPQTPTRPLLVPEIKPTLTPKPEVNKNIVNFKFTQGFENAIKPYGIQGELLREIITKTGNRYAEKYGCSLNLITIDVTDVSTIKVLPDGKMQYDADSSIRGNIKLPVKDFITLFTNNEKVIFWANLGKELQDTIIHSMGHACMGPEILISKKIDVGNGEKAYGFQGLTVLMELANGSKTLFTKVEEGMLEAFAINLESSYGNKAPSYMRLRSLSQMIIKKGWVSIDEVNSYLKTSNFLGFLQKLYGKPNIINVDIANTLDIYSELFIGTITPEQALLEIEGLRIINK